MSSGGGPIEDRTLAAALIGGIAAHGEGDLPPFRGKRLMTDRPDIYICAKLADGSAEWAGKNFGTVKDRQVGFRRAVIDERVDGDYAIRLSRDSAPPAAGSPLAPPS